MISFLSLLSGGVINNDTNTEVWIWRAIYVGSMIGWEGLSRVIPNLYSRVTVLMVKCCTFGRS